MKKLSLLLTLGLFACSSNETEQKIDERYAHWQKGNFYYNDEIFGKFEIERTDSTQVEKIVKNGMEVVFDIDWVNDSVYTLKYAGITKNPNNLRLPDDIDSLIKTCTITQITDTSYNERATSNLNKSVNYTLIKI